MRILFLSRWFPFPPNNGSKLRIYNLLRGLGMHHAVTLVSFADELNGQPDVTSMQGICDETYLVPWKGYDPISDVGAQGFLQPHAALSRRYLFASDGWRKSARAWLRMTMTL